MEVKPDRPFPWESSYPDGVVWDALIERSPIPDLLRASAAAHPDREAVDYRGLTLCYGDLAAKAWQVANALARDGFGSGRTIALLLPNTLYHPLWFFGALAAGGRVAHLSPLDAQRVLKHKLQDSGSTTLVTVNLPQLTDIALKLLDDGAATRVILCDEAAFGPFPAPLAETPDRPDVTSYGDFVADAPTTDPGSAPCSDDVALLQYTGGTTGLPKGAVLTHGNLTAAVSMFDAWYAYDADPERRDVTLCVLPLFHIFALTTVLLRQIKHGGKILIRMRFDATEALDDIETYRVTGFAGVPTMWIAVTNHPEIEARDLSSLRLTASGGAPMPVEVARRFEALTGLQLLGGWGMTETSPAGTALPRHLAKEKPDSVGVPLPGLEMKIVDLEDSGVDLPADEIGEIAIRGPNVTSGYWNRPDANEKAFADGWFLTGDVGRMDEDGFFYLVDRRSDMILSGGFNVYPQMVEQAIYEHPSVAEALVIGVPDDYRGESAKAFVTLRDGATRFTVDELREFLDGRLGRHELPREVEFRDELPRTPVGKLSRKDLRDQEASRRESEKDAAA